MAKQWSIKDNRGKVYGPLESSKIIELINNGLIDGDEQISPYRSGQWIALSMCADFYDQLIEALKKPSKPRSQKEKENELLGAIEKPHAAYIPNADEMATKEIKKPKRGYVIPQKEHKTSRVEKYANESNEKIIELKSSFEKLKSRTSENLIKILIFLGALMALAAIYMDDKNPVSTEKIHLLLPQKHGANIGAKQANEMFRIALEQFQKDSFRGYHKAENILVDLLESNSDNGEALALLCLTYRELWEFVQKDSQDYQTLSKIVQLATSADPIGINGSTCRAAVALLKNQIENADTLIQGVLIEQPTAAVFYEMKAEILAQQRNYETAIAYLQKTQALWPEWLKPFVREAQYRKKINDANNAAKILRNVIEHNPEHAEAKINLGIIELFDFQHPDIAIDLILLGLEQDRVTRATTLMGYSALAAYYQRVDKKQKALEFAKKAFLLDPTNVDMRDLVVQLGGQKEFEKIQTQEDEVLALGDQYFKTGNYLAAQAEYKAAYEVNKKNASAALKAAQSLAKIHQPIDAIEWAKKAVIADPRYVEAYYELADYYSQRYDFKVAVDYLSQAQKQVPNHYLTFRGRALVDLRRKDLKSAVANAEKALQLYETDIQSHLIISRAYFQLADYEKAYQYASRALELDEHNFETQETYATALGGTQGVRASQDYLKNLIYNYPNVGPYRFALAKIYFNDEHYSDAIQALDGALQLDNENVEGLILLGNSYKLINEQTKALKAYLQAAGIDPTNAEPLYLIGLLYSESEKTSSTAIQYFERIARINPQFPRTNYWIGKLLLKKGDYKKAWEYANREKKINPNLSDAFYLSGEIYMAQNNFTQATNEFRKAIQLRPQDVSLYIILARAYRLSGQLDVATSMIKIAATKESGNPEIYKEQGAIFEKRGQSDEAVLSYNRYLELKPNAPDKEQIEQRIISLGGGP